MHTFCLNFESVAVELRFVSFLLICFSLIHKQEQCQPHGLMYNILSTLWQRNIIRSEIDERGSHRFYLTEQAPLVPPYGAFTKPVVMWSFPQADDSYKAMGVPV